MSIFAELKRRNVFRVGAAYMVTAWLQMQIAVLAFEDMSPAMDQEYLSNGIA